MRRAILATAGTVAAVVAILQYKSSGNVEAGSHVIPVAGPTPSTSPTESPATPASSAPSGGGAATTPSSSASSAGGSATTPSSTTPSAGGAATTPSTTQASEQFTGTDVPFQYGELEVRITVRGGKIVDVSYPVDQASDPRSEFINSQALAILTREVLAAQSLHIDSVSGATYTSDAFAQSIQAALTEAGK